MCGGSGGRVEKGLPMANFTNFLNEYHFRDFMPTGIVWSYSCIVDRKRTVHWLYWKLMHIVIK